MTPGHGILVKRLPNCTALHAGIHLEVRAMGSDAVADWDPHLATGISGSSNTLTFH